MLKFEMKERKKQTSQRGIILGIQSGFITRQIVFEAFFFKWKKNPICFGWLKIIPKRKSQGMIYE